MSANIGDTLVRSEFEVLAVTDDLALLHADAAKMTRLISFTEQKSDVFIQVTLGGLNVLAGCFLSNRST